jgi:hypothetical protein
MANTKGAGKSLRLFAFVSSVGCCAGDRRRGRPAQTLR